MFKAFTAGSFSRAARIATVTIFKVGFFFAFHFEKRKEKN
jgi:hypothetical protein